QEGVDELPSRVGLGPFRRGQRDLKETDGFRRRGSQRPAVPHQLGVLAVVPSVLLLRTGGSFREFQKGSAQPQRAVGFVGRILRLPGCVQALGGHGRGLAPAAAQVLYRGGDDQELAGQGGIPLGPFVPFHGRQGRVGLGEV